MLEAINGKQYQLKRFKTKESSNGGFFYLSNDVTQEGDCISNNSFGNMLITMHQLVSSISYIMPFPSI